MYRGTADSIYFVGDYNDWELQDKMIKLPNMDLWYITKVFPENSRFDYKYVIDGNWITDPLNKNVTAGGAGNNSTLIMPKYKSEYDEIIAANVPRGRHVIRTGWIRLSYIGVSWGSLTSIYLAVCAPGQFSRVLSQSGPFWPKNWLIFDLVGETVTPQIKFCLQTGTIQDTEEINDAMVNILTAKGYKADYL
ncbi:hypothetical protein [Pseudobacteroides cellulosolvens]|uniref:hypothetical protein n=1 Tax=Pseudobacteroides cellulosolvens TaxID=35825 RepID=UPI0009DF249B|nr:hypothetical protein [Pseudobacteroides cellulosolvens]